MIKTEIRNSEMPKSCKVARKFVRSAKSASYEEAKKTECYRKTLKADYVQKHQKSNGDLVKYCKDGFIGSFTKGLPHDANGIVDTSAFLILLKAIQCNRWNDIVLGAPLTGYKKSLLANPQAIFFSTPTGFNTQAISTPPAPTLSSDEGGAEMVELYLMVANRDVPFTDFNTINVTPLVNLIGYTGPTPVTTSNVFRGNSAGDLIGPYISQLLLQDASNIVGTIPQSYNSLTPGTNYLTDRNEWLKAQNGNVLTTQSFTGINRYIFNGRQLANYVHSDPPCQAWLNASNILSRLAFPLSPTNPYANGTITTQGPFITFGQPDLHVMITDVSQLALAVAWHTKWQLEFRLRPEEYSGLIDDQVRLGVDRGLPTNIINSSVLTPLVPTKLLSQVYPEGAPLHPSYPSGHAATAGACATILKAFFNGATTFATPFQSSMDGLTLIPFVGVGLTLNNELDKMASNMSYGRNWSGIHYRSDAEQGILLGERVAIEYLRQRKHTYNEKFKGFEITTRSGKYLLIR